LIPKIIDLGLILPITEFIFKSILFVQNLPSGCMPDKYDLQVNGGAKSYKEYLLRRLFVCINESDMPSSESEHRRVSLFAISKVLSKGDQQISFLSYLESRENDHPERSRFVKACDIIERLPEPLRSDCAHGVLLRVATDRYDSALGLAQLLVEPVVPNNSNIQPAMPPVAQAVILEVEQVPAPLPTINNPNTQFAAPRAALEVDQALASGSVGCSCVVS
jgi:hypothetical protein